MSLLFFFPMCTAQVTFEILEKVTVYEDVYAYDMFSLIVDLGSALGLWLGLSACSIFDSLLLIHSYYPSIKRRFFY